MFHNMKHIKQHCLAAILVSILLLTGPLTRAQQPLTNQHLFDTLSFIPDHYAGRLEKFRKEAVVTGRILFLGNSITEGGHWRELTGDSTVINRGISGDITFGVLKRLDELIRYQPSKIFLLIGVNDIGKDIPDAVIADNCKKIIERIRAGSPGTRLYLQSILPVNPDYPGFPQHYNKEPHVIHTNQLLRKVAAETHCPFVNLFPLFLDHKKRMAEKYTVDGLHLNRQGYEVWVSYLREKGYL